MQDKMPNELYIFDNKGYDNVNYKGDVIFEIGTTKYTRADLVPRGDVDHWLKSSMSMNTVESMRECIKIAREILRVTQPTPAPEGECLHVWEHLHGTDKNNEWRCHKCGARK